MLLQRSRVVYMVFVNPSHFSICACLALGWYCHHMPLPSLSDVVSDRDPTTTSSWRVRTLYTDISLSFIQHICVYAEVCTAIFVVQTKLSNYYIVKILRHVAVAWLLRISNLTLIIYIKFNLFQRTELVITSLLLVPCRVPPRITGVPSYQGWQRRFPHFIFHWGKPGGNWEKPFGGYLVKLENWEKL